MTKTYTRGTIGYLLANEFIDPSETYSEADAGEKHLGRACNQSFPCLDETPEGEFCPDYHRCDCNPVLECGARARFSILIADSPATGRQYSHYCADCRNRVLFG